ncbi:MAG TPA: hypothetical protein VK689_16110, partial [Armatimonadota bacterium]|nr:hypothetical protein [Armatimonadota bacterium]
MLLFCAVLALAAVPDGRSCAAARLATTGPQVSALVERLSAVSERESTEARDPYSAQGNVFWPIYPERPEVSPVMRQLVALGVEALPMLIRHLGDSRPTRLTIPEGGGSLLWFGDTYEPRFRDPRNQPRGVNTETVHTYADRGAPRATLDSYTFRVGDLCYVAIGKIVNRSLNAEEGTPRNLILNSPLERPALISAVKHDWEGLTPQQHRRSLRLDVASYSARRGGADALTRLCYYYPTEGEAFALQILARPIRDQRPADAFHYELLDKAQPSSWKPMVKDFNARHARGDQVDLIRLLLGYSHFPLNTLRETEEAEPNEL